MAENIDSEIEKKVKADYEAVVKIESEKKLAEQESEIAKKFEDVRRLGFMTKQDLEERINKDITKMSEELEKMRKENIALREFVLRAKAQGLHSGILEEEAGKSKNNPLLDGWKKYSPQKKL